MHNLPIDTYRDAFLKFLAEGMTYAEALSHFDEDAWNMAAMAEIFTNEAKIDISTREFLTNDSRKLPSLFLLGVRANRQITDDLDLQEQAIPLYLAGWQSEVPDSFKHNSKDFWRQCPTMSLYWRAPSKRAGKPGRLYRSTNQAFRAMTKALA